MRTRRVGSSRSCVATAEKWGHNVPSCWRFRNKANTAILSSSSSTLMATDVDTKELGPMDSGSENAEKSWLGMVVGFCSDQSVLHGLCDFRACVSEKLCHSRDFVSQNLVYARSGVQRDGSARRSVHKTSDAVHDLVGNRRFSFDTQ